MVAKARVFLICQDHVSNGRREAADLIPARRLPHPGMIRRIIG
jgi:hypothetical protein